MIVRELWCNALDEGGEVREITETLTCDKGKTTFYIQLSTELKQVWDNWSDYFIHDITPMFESNEYRIYPGGNGLRLYKQGVLIHENKSSKSLFSYDIRNASINELRQFMGSASREACHALAQANSKVIQYYLEHVNSECYEAEMDYDWFVSFGDQWRDTIGNAKIIHKDAISAMKERGISVDSDRYIIVPKNVYKFLTKQFKGVGALMTADKIHEFFEVYDEQLDGRINQALAVLEACGYFIHPELRFIYGVFADKSVYARINIEDKLIMVSEQMVNRPLFDVVAMIIEENEHFNTGHSDCSRQFQQHFIDLYTKTLLDKNEVPV